MVRIRADRVDEELARRGWPRTQLIPTMGIGLGTYQNMFAGKGISTSTQNALFDAFGGEVPAEELFEVVIETSDVA